MFKKMRTLSIVLVIGLFSGSVHAVTPLEDKAARIELKGNVEIFLEGEKEVLRLKRVNPNEERQILADLKRIDATLERASSVSISEEGFIVVGIAKKTLPNNSVQLFLFMFQPNTDRPSIFGVTSIVDNKIQLNKAYTNVLSNNR